jgi:hypothetical protein
VRRDAKLFSGWPTKTRVNFATASLPAEYTDIHPALVAAVATLEQEQSRGFQRIIPKALAFRSQKALAFRSQAAPRMVG